MTSTVSPYTGERPRLPAASTLRLANSETRSGEEEDTPTSGCGEAIGGEDPVGPGATALHSGAVAGAVERLLLRGSFSVKRLCVNGRGT